MTEVEVDSVIPGSSLKTFSLNLEEVNDNPDELIDLRGEGRYFGAVDKPGPVCRNCHKTGHIAAQCKTVVCLACGVIDDHYSEHCPNSITCSNCGEKGHYKNACTKKQRRIFCQTCNSTKHNTDRCPQIWRSYITSSVSNKRAAYPYRFIFCYNCAAKGHYGDDCPEARSSRIPNFDGSAFAGDNLPQSLRDQYWTLFRKRKYEGGIDGNSSDEEEDLIYGKGGSGASTGANFFHYDYNKPSKEDESDKKGENDQPGYEKTKLGKKEKKKLQKKLKNEKKNNQDGGHQRKKRKLDNGAGSSGGNFKNDKKFNNNSNNYYNASKNNSQDRNNHNNRNIDRLKPRRSGTIAPPPAAPRSQGQFPRGPRSQNQFPSGPRSQNGGQSYTVPTSQSFNFQPKLNNNNNNYKKNTNGIRIPQPLKRSGYLPPKGSSQGGGNMNIKPSRSGTIGGGNDKKRNNKKKQNRY